MIFLTYWIFLHLLMQLLLMHDCNTSILLHNSYPEPNNNGNVINLSNNNENNNAWSALDWCQVKVLLCIESLPRMWHSKANFSFMLVWMKWNIKINIPQVWKLYSINCDSTAVWNWKFKKDYHYKMYYIIQ